MKSLEEMKEKMIGLKLNDIGRCAAMTWMCFSDNEEIIGNDYYSLHLQCPWRMIQKNTIVLSDKDMNTYVSGMDFKRWDDKEENMFDKNSKVLQKEGNYYIENIDMTEYNDLIISFTNDLVLEAYAFNLNGENWRVFKKKEAEHFIV